MMPYFSSDSIVMGRCLKQQKHSNQGWKARTVIEAGIITNLVSAAGSRPWHRTGANERKGHAQIYCLSPPNHFHGDSSGDISPLFWDPILCLTSPLSPFSFLFFPGSVAREVFLQYHIRGKDTDFDFIPTWIHSPV